MVGLLTEMMLPVALINLLQVCLKADSDCQRQVLDLVVLMPASNSVQSGGINGWANLVTFVTEILSQMNVAAFATQVGIVRLVLPFANLSITKQ